MMSRTRRTKSNANHFLKSSLLKLSALRDRTALRMRMSCSRFALFKEQLIDLSLGCSNPPSALQYLAGNRSIGMTTILNEKGAIMNFKKLGVLSLFALLVTFALTT